MYWISPLVFACLTLETVKTLLVQLDKTCIAATLDWTSSDISLLNHIFLKQNVVDLVNHLLKHRKSAQTFIDDSICVNLLALFCSSCSWTRSFSCCLRHILFEICEPPACETLVAHSRLARTVEGTLDFEAFLEADITAYFWLILYLSDVLWINARFTRWSNHLFLILVIVSLLFVSHLC